LGRPAWGDQPIVSPGFRYLIIGIVVLGGIAIYGWIKYEEKESERRQRTAAAQERAAQSALSRTDITLDDVQLKKESSWWVLKGSVTNNSKYRLGSLGFIVRIEDCPPQKGYITIGQESVRAIVSVPPGRCGPFHPIPSTSRGCLPPAALAGATRSLKSGPTECGWASSCSSARPHCALRANGRITSVAETDIRLREYNAGIHRAH
jgi:hypothetical protein